MIDQIDEKSFDARVRKSAQPVLVDFYGKQCGPCKKLLPVLEEIAKEFGPKAAFVKMDVDESTDVAAELGVMSVPTIVLFKGGQPVDLVEGMATKADLTARLKKLTG